MRNFQTLLNSMLTMNILNLKKSIKDNCLNKVWLMADQAQICAKSSAHSIGFTAIVEIWKILIS